MGLFSRLSGSSGAYKTVIEYSEKQQGLLQAGYKVNDAYEIFSPDTVWIGPRSKVYHAEDCCAGFFVTDAVPFPEAEGVRRGLHRCKKCEWRSAEIPKACKRPAKPSRPVSKANVRKGWK